ncbi:MULTISPECIES: Holliday junction resolvase-like protein [unclassified Acinetobacter]|uniref:Holliday junction resolvase-like protein n=1 Tax=unclassified Acinetobacter TaxID=196816 RepID=UPI00103D88F5|nr:MULTISPECIES: Holliday junction resolvase-like protein [unclassified Acinetobacter]TCB13484.1 endonuclease [Acinetobacter sp. ANC 4641]TCB25195.1 endonuclease [Acinetobacter sp. ANC 4633]TCB33442.1 endonuclease [Acinetobacter sp. ANC 4635]
MPIWIAMVIGLGIGVILTYALLSNLRNGKIQAEYEVQISELKRKHQKELRLAQSRSVNSSRAILKGRMAEQFAPIFPEFEYLPSDAKFLGDPVDYIVFNGYNSFRDGDGRADEIEVVLIDIKSGNARLTKGQQAIADAIKKGRIRFETIRVEFED